MTAFATPNPAGRRGPHPLHGRSARRPPAPRHGGPGYAFGRRAGRGDIRAAILVLLAEEPMHGYQIIQELVERTGGVWRPSPGSVYPTLQQLQDEELVQEAPSDSGKRVYELTDTGREQAAGATAPWSEVTGESDRRARDAPRPRPPGDGRDAPGGARGHRRPARVRPGDPPGRAARPLSPPGRGRTRRGRSRRRVTARAGGRPAASGPLSAVLDDRVLRLEEAVGVDLLADRGESAVVALRVEGHRVDVSLREIEVPSP